MTLNFPNPSRSFDDRRNAVQFVGHDGVFEIRFFVEAGALGGGSVEEANTSEATCLSAFDRLRSSIQDAARSAYSSTRLRSYTISRADLLPASVRASAVSKVGAMRAHFDRLRR